jgi:hypothetical protein
MFAVRRLTKSSRILMTIALGAAVGAGPAIASPASAAPGGAVNLSALLSGAKENPAADPDGWGAANVRVWPWSGKICYTLFVRQIATPTAAHIHAGKAGVNGDVKVELNAPTMGWSTGCEWIGKSLAWKLAVKPSRYYVNVHNAAYPNGAIRGQLWSAGGWHGSPHA